jgi:hypothetical protein
VKETGRRRAEKCCAAAEAMAENRDRAGADFRHRVEMAERRIDIGKNLGDIGKNLGVGEEIDGDVGALAGWPPVEKIRLAAKPFAASRATTLRVKSSTPPR